MLAVFATALLAGALLLALWADVRLGAAAPARLVTVTLHLAAAVIAVALSVRAMAAVDGSRPLAVLSVIGGFFPALAYAFVSALWLLKVVQRAVVRS